MKVAEQAAGMPKQEKRQSVALMFGTQDEPRRLAGTTLNKSQIEMQHLMVLFLKFVIILLGCSSVPLLLALLSLLCLLSLSLLSLFAAPCRTCLFYHSAILFAASTSVSRAVNSFSLPQSRTSPSFSSSILLRFSLFSLLLSLLFPFSQGYPVCSLDFSQPSGEQFLVATGSTRAKLFNRDGREVAHYAKGDMYLVDLKNTKGHVTSLTQAWFNPTTKAQFLTSSLDGQYRSEDWFFAVDRCELCIALIPAL